MRSRAVPGRLLAFAMVIVGVSLGAYAAVDVAQVSTSISEIAEATTTATGLAARGRTLAVTLAKDVALLRSPSVAPADASATKTELFETARAITEMLRTFTDGGDVEAPHGTRRHVGPLEAPAERTQLATLRDLWTPMESAIAGHAADLALTPATVTDLSRVVLPHADDLASAANELANEIAVDGADRGARLSARRVTAATLAAVGFLIVLGAIVVRVIVGGGNIRRYSEQLQGLLSRLAAQSAELESAKGETDLIMSTVSQGLFLLDSRHQIAPQHSRELASILRTKQIDGRDFFDVLRPLVSEKVFAMTTDYFSLLFDPTKSDRILERINPLDEIEVNFADRNGGFDSRYLSFVFRRIFDDQDRVARVFVAVTDSTARVVLEKRLRAAEQKKERQFGLLLSIINVDQRSLDDFETTASEQLQAMNDGLRAEDFAGRTHHDVLVKRLDMLFRAAHNMKGNAAALGLDAFARQCETFEDRVRDLKNETPLGGDAFLGLVLILSSLRESLDELTELRSTLTNVVSLRRTAQTPVVDRELLVEDFGDYLQGLATTIATSLGKSVIVRSAHLDLDVLGSKERRAVKDILIQLIRNSVVHGIELPAERMALGKSAVGEIIVRSSIVDRSYRFEVRDDGGGLDIDRIRQRALARGIVVEASRDALDDSKIVACIFEPGFSTAEESSPHAGRGMGLDVVKETIIAKLHGEMNLDSQRHAYTQFRFSLPLHPAAAPLELAAWS